ncbi:hypothetical protein I6N90_13330 [Paenibacillus sp. GSMTC-2017]|uniref:hypothetical protein n=1 Tax=Paenibacillus sp. GSMTC-2017 TaxID=2794350 RepID=UPI0018D92B1F|nr:hypothetical protein [Paenibacillus sp. GSMTC-2017]MBH5318783.1 hypothetical protein [Paenibacillus sp. GSMTC-2017]
MTKQTKEEVVRFLHTLDKKEYEKSPLLWDAHQKLRELLDQFDDMDKVFAEWQNTIEYQRLGVTENESIIEDEVYVPYVAISHGIEIVKELGIPYSKNQLENRLIELGKIAGIEDSFPMAEYLSFLNGTLITNPSLSEKLFENREKIVMNISENEGKYIKIINEPTIIVYTIRNGNEDREY